MLFAHLNDKGAIIVNQIGFEPLTSTIEKNRIEALIGLALDHQWKGTLEKLLSYGSSAGADLVEIFIEKSDNFSVLVEEDEITSVTPSFGIGVGVRVFKGVRDGFVSTNDVTERGLKYALDQALKMLSLDSIKNNRIKFIELNPIKNYATGKEKWTKLAPDINETCIKLLQSTDSLRQKGSNLQSRRGSYSRTSQEVLIAASDGTFGRDIRLHQTYGLNTIAADRSYRSSVARRYGSSDNPDDLRHWNYKQSAEEICESAHKMLYADYVMAGQMPVVLANKFGGVIFHEACGHLLETTQLERNTSPFSGMINKKIANKAVTAVDEGISKNAFGSMSMDDEGMPPQETLLIENGILKKFISDRAGELRTGHPRTGSGRRQNYSFASASRMRNTYIKAGNYNPNELINSIDNGLYCKSMGGGSVGPTGQFNFSVEEGYIIKNGKLEKPVKGATLIGEAKDILPKISMCGNDLDLAPGFCGSVSGSVNVTVGQPHIKVDSITVGGR